MRRIRRIAWWWGPYIGLGLVVWRQQSLEARLSEFVAAASKMLGLATKDLADQATEVYQEGVSQSAQRN